MIMLTRLLRARRGAAATEFALLMPVLAVLIVAAWDLGSAYNHYVRLTGAVRTAFSFVLAGKGADLPGITKYVQANAPNATVNPVMECTCNGIVQICATACNTNFARYVRITATDRYTPIFAWPYIPLADGEDYVEMSTTLEMQVE